VPQRLTIKNTGLGVLHGDLVAPNGRFTVMSGGGGFTLKNKGSWPVTIQFTPPAKGVAIGRLPLASDDPKHGIANLNLKGAGK
jgi:hypothetical protein